MEKNYTGGYEDNSSTYATNQKKNMPQWELKLFDFKRKTLLNSIKVARHIGIKEEIEKLEEILDIAISQRDFEGFNIVKNRYLEVYNEGKKLEREIEKAMDELDEFIKKEKENLYKMSEKYDIPKEFIDNIFN